MKYLSNIILIAVNVSLITLLVLRIRQIDNDKGVVVYIFGYFILLGLNLVGLLIQKLLRRGGSNTWLYLLGIMFVAFFLLIPLVI